MQCITVDTEPLHIVAAGCLQWMAVGGTMARLYSRRVVSSWSPPGVRKRVSNEPSEEDQHHLPQEDHRRHRRRHRGRGLRLSRPHCEAPFWKDGDYVSTLSEPHPPDSLRPFGGENSFGVPSSGRSTILALVGAFLYPVCLIFHPIRVIFYLV